MPALNQMLIGEWDLYEGFFHSVLRLDLAGGFWIGCDDGVHRSWGKWGVEDHNPVSFLVLWTSGFEPYAEPNPYGQAPLTWPAVAAWPILQANAATAWLGDARLVRRGASPVATPSNQGAAPLGSQNPPAVALPAAPIRHEYILPPASEASLPSPRPAPGASATVSAWWAAANQGQPASSGPGPTPTPAPAPNAGAQPINTFGANNGWLEIVQKNSERMTELINEQCQAIIDKTRDENQNFQYHVPRFQFNIPHRTFTIPRRW